ncbi:GNAT family N-acetyltransferase [Rothia sp. HC945]|uniref:GNAT family N-acetyltransferase n=1 Tax=Rothia sp. HC945 TaxID=3171170 RepID=UPI00264EFE02|nr:GNAT family N-acetyltransferase [Kocuria sp.]
MSLEPFELRTIVDGNGKATDEYRRFHARVERGFHEDPGTPEVQDFLAREYQEAGFVHRGYAETEGVPAWASESPQPVATIVGFPRSMEVGEKALDLWAISGVGVASSHRRRGLLRTMMTTELAGAQRDGYGLAGLTVSEGGIYGRFGFGVATRVGTYELDLRRRPRILPGVMESTGAACGRVVEGDPQRLLDVAERICEQSDAGRAGKIDRLRGYVKNVLGQVNLEETSLEPVRGREALVYIGSSGPEGYVTYDHSGLDSDPLKAKIIDFQAVTAAAWVGLWNHLFSVDLLETVDFKDAPGMALSSILENPRAVTAARESDLVWTRILDVASVLESRRYPRDGEIVLLVDDPMGLVTGAYAMHIEQGKATVTPSADVSGTQDRGDRARDDVALAPHAPRVRFPVDRLATAVFRGCEIEARLGVVVGDGAERAAEIFAVDREPYCDFEF